MGFNFRRFREDRDKAFTAFVMSDDWDAINEYCAKYGVKMSNDPVVVAAGVYKAVQEVKDIPDEVKVKAMIKCMKLGFTPFIEPEGRG